MQSKRQGRSSTSSSSSSQHRLKGNASVRPPAPRRKSKGSRARLLRCDLDLMTQPGRPVRVEIERRARHIHDPRGDQTQGVGRWIPKGGRAPASTGRKCQFRTLSVNRCQPRLLWVARVRCSPPWGLLSSDPSEGKPTIVICGSIEPSRFDCECMGRDQGDELKQKAKTHTRAQSRSSFLVGCLLACLSFRGRLDSGGGVVPFLPSLFASACVVASGGLSFFLLTMIYAHLRNAPLPFPIPFPLPPRFTCIVVLERITKKRGGMGCPGTDRHETHNTQHTPPPSRPRCLAAAALLPSRASAAAASAAASAAGDVHATMVVVWCRLPPQSLLPLPRSCRCPKPTPTPNPFTTLHCTHTIMSIAPLISLVRSFGLDSVLITLLPLVVVVVADDALAPSSSFPPAPPSAHQRGQEQQQAAAAAIVVAIEGQRVGQGKSQDLHHHTPRPCITTTTTAHHHHCPQPPQTPSVPSFPLSVPRTRLRCWRRRGRCCRRRCPWRGRLCVFVHVDEPTV